MTHQTIYNNPSAIEIIPLNAPLGAEIRGLDLARPLANEVVQMIDAAWQQYLVLLIREQTISEAQLIDFSRHFGELDPPGPNPYGEPFHKEFPEINIISNIVADGKPTGNLGAGEAVWHADMTYIDVPPKAAILYALEIPENAGNTYFANMFAAYEALPEELKQAIDGKSAIHDASLNSAGLRRKGYTEITDVRQTPGSHHPLVRTEPQTGRKALFLGRRRNSYIVGMDVAASEALLDMLWAHAGNMRFAMCHEWRAGDVLMWQNLAVLHRRDAFDADSRRRLHRTQLKGEQRIV
jgi:taurine dioxygenase